MAPHNLFGGEVRLPDLVILLHTREGIKYDEHPAVKDSAKAGIPTVAVVDSDCNPNLVTYPIPGNDDSPQSTQLYLALFKQAIMLGKKYREKIRTKKENDQLRETETDKTLEIETETA